VRQLQRADKLNHAMTPRDIERYCPVDKKIAALLEQAVERWGLSARAYHRIIKVARTVAALAEVSSIEAARVSEAISYRKLDRQPSSAIAF
jgi:magnesium chelatase family protein